MHFQDTQYQKLEDKLASTQQQLDQAQAEMLALTQAVAQVRGGNASIMMGGARCSHVGLAHWTQPFFSSS